MAKFKSILKQCMNKKPFTHFKAVPHCPVKRSTLAS